MTQITRCPNCGIQTDADLYDSGCPNCLMQLGLQAGGEIENDRSTFAERDDRPNDFAGLNPQTLNDRIPNVEIIDLLGEGGMGAVYKARQLNLDRIVAVKIIKPDLNDPGFADRFRREAQTMARLNHPHIVTIYEFGSTGDMFYLVMEYVDGTTLRQLIESRELNTSQALTIVPELCDALQFAHDQGVVHRDIKPENILIDRQGHVRIADFGLAKMLRSQVAQQNLTRTGQVMGTPQYMAPEQIETPTEVDHRADIYSLGVVFYEMLTGELPIGKFQLPSQRVQVDVRLDEVVMRALEKQPEQRYQLASQVATEVNSLKSKLPPVASHLAPAYERRYWLEIVLNSVVGGLMTIAVAFGMWFTQSPEPIYAFCLSWIMIGAAVEFWSQESRYEIWIVTGFVFTCYVALLIAGVVISESARPFWSVSASFFAFAFGCYVGEEDRKKRKLAQHRG